MSLFDISTLNSTSCSRSTLYEIWNRNESEIVRYVGTSRDHCRYLEANANNNLTFREMHEPMYGFYRQGSAPEPYKLENSEKFDVATVSANLPPLEMSLFRARAIESVHGSKVDISRISPRATILPCTSMANQCHALHCWLPRYIRVFDLSTGGRKATARPTRQRSRAIYIPESGLLT